MSPRHDLRRPFRPRVEPLEARELLSVCLVDRLTDLGEGKDFVGDLRYCLTEAQDGDSVQFAVKGTINLTRALPSLTRSISIEGPGANLLTVGRSTYGVDYRIFTVSGLNVRISGLAISGGRDLVGDGHGGNIFNTGTLTISDSVISDGVSFEGAGIYNEGTLTVWNSRITSNSGFVTQGRGAGISNAGTLAVHNSTLDNNLLDAEYCTRRCQLDGVGIYNRDTGIALISNSTISGNTFRVGWYEESWGRGGGISNKGMMTVSNCTLTSNTTGIYNYDTGALSVRNTVVARNKYAPPGTDVDGRITSFGYNLIGDSRGGIGYDKTDLLDVDPLLGPLQDNGGPTLTHALLPGSPALDAGDPTDAPKWDQRGEGYYRIAGKNIDIGAYEEQGGVGPVPGSVSPPRFVTAADIDPGVLLLLETPTRRMFFGWQQGGAVEE